MSDSQAAHAGYFDLISGRRRGPLAALLRGLLTLATLPYGAALVLRRGYYCLAARRVELPVISIGNLTVGGTGKTPLVALVAKRMVELGHRPLIVSRGYKRRGGGPGDEAAALREELPSGVLQVESPDRYQAIRDTVAHSPRDVVILDDGFQHIKLRRDLDFVTIDATAPFGYGHLLPRGLLREPLSALRRADAVVITRSDQVDPAELRRIEAALSRHLRPGAPLLHARHQPAYLRMIGAKLRRVEELRGLKVAAFCGLANPAAFYRTLETLGVKIVARRDFADHHHYEARDVAALAALAMAKTAAAEMIVTTTKDFAKVGVAPLSTAWPAEPPLAALGVELEFLEPRQLFDEILERLLGAETLPPNGRRKRR